MKRKEQIEQAASQLFEKQGYSGTSMRDLAENVGMEASSLYAHVKSKEEILQKICFRMAYEFFMAIDKVGEETNNPLDQLEQAIKGHIEVIIKNGSASTVFFSEWKHMGSIHLDVFTKMRHDYENKFQKIIEDGVDQGIFMTQDSKFTALTILASMNWIQNRNASGNLNAEEIGNQIAYLFINGLKNN